MAGYTVFRRDRLELTPPSAGDQRRRIQRLSPALHASRANVWLMPPGARGRRHRERVQEELFVALEGTTTMLVGDPGEPVELPAGSVMAVEPGTPLQMQNRSDADALVLVVGAPPVEGQAEYLPE